MADISSYLQAILDAVYGEEVRWSIHDAIEIINDVSEVVITAGTAVTTASSSSEGFFVDSLYINTNTYDLWKCVGTNAWSNLGNLKGAGITSVTKTATAGLVDTYTITFSNGTTSTFNITNGADGSNGSTWYRGTAIAGTGSGITGFPGIINDFYLNSSTGNVYVCTKTGAATVPDAAEWEYVMTLTGGGGGSTINVINNLTSSSTTDALAANQGRVLKNMVDDKADAASLASVATSGSYNDLSDKPVFPTWHEYNGSVEEITMTSSATAQNVVFHNVSASGGYQPWADSPSNKQLTFIGDPTYNETDSVNHTGTLTYSVIVSENNTKFYLLEIS